MATEREWVATVMPFDHFKIKLVDPSGGFLGYECELCGFQVTVVHGRIAFTASSAMTNHIKSKHPKEYEEKVGHPPIWRYKDWEHRMGVGWRRKNDHVIDTLKKRAIYKKLGVER